MYFTPAILQLAGVADKRTALLLALVPAGAPPLHPPPPARRPQATPPHPTVPHHVPIVLPRTPIPFLSVCVSCCCSMPLELLMYSKGRLGRGGAGVNTAGTVVGMYAIDRCGRRWGAASQTLTHRRFT